jgi:NagD protein
MVLGETRNYSFEAVTTAIRLIRDGARFVATNPDPTGPSGAGVLPPTGSVAAAHSEATVMIGDRMDTDIVAGIEVLLGSAVHAAGNASPQVRALRQRTLCRSVRGGSARRRRRFTRSLRPG